MLANIPNRDLYLNEILLAVKSLLIPNDLRGMFVSFKIYHKLIRLSAKIKGLQVFAHVHFQIIFIDAMGNKQSTKLYNPQIVKKTYF